MLAGHADRSGSATYNVGLSNRRNDAVRSYLTARGISDGSIGAQGFGETRPDVATADGVRNDQNRRVEITYGPNSGMAYWLPSPTGTGRKAGRHRTMPPLFHVRSTRRRRSTLVAIRL